MTSPRTGPDHHHDVAFPSLDDARLAVPEPFATGRHLRDGELLSQAGDRSGGGFVVLRGSGDLEAFFDDVQTHLGGLVNNAGIAGATAPVEEHPPDIWNAVLGVNLMGTLGTPAGGGLEDGGEQPGDPRRQTERERLRGEVGLSEPR